MANDGINDIKKECIALIRLGYEDTKQNMDSDKLTKHCLNLMYNLRYVGIETVDNSVFDTIYEITNKAWNIADNDGSYVFNPEKVFQAISESYSPYGWKFIDKRSKEYKDLLRISDIANTYYYIGVYYGNDELECMNIQNKEAFIQNMMKALEGRINY